VLALQENFRVEAISFVVDTGGAGGPNDVTLTYLTQNGDVIVEAAVGLGQAVGVTAQYAISPYLNPCDGAVWSGIGVTPDTFADILLTHGCAVVITAVDSTTGAVDNGATIIEGVIWADLFDTVVLANLAPIYLPVPTFGLPAAPVPVAAAAPAPAPAPGSGFAAGG